MTIATSTAQTPAPSAPLPPPAPPVPGVAVEVPGVTTLPGVPQTMQELRALRERRSELSDQLVSAANRRDQLVEELATASGANRAGLEGRLQVLDTRIVQLESDIAETGRQLTGAPAHLLASSTTSLPGVGPEGLENGQVTAISIVGIVFVGFPLAIAMARLMWKRAVAPSPQLPRETNDRLQRMEQAVDAIAIEVERVSEGQRFLTRLFAGPGGAAGALGGGRVPEPLRVPDAEGRAARETAG